MKIIKKINRLFIAAITAVSMFAGFIPSDIAVAAEEAPNIWYMGTQVNTEEIFRIQVMGQNFDNVGSLVFTIQYDAEILKLNSYETGSAITGSLISVNDNNGLITIAIVNTHGISCDFQEVILVMDFDIIGSDKYWTDFVYNVIECTDTNSLPVEITCEPSSSFYIDNSASRFYNHMWTSSDWQADLYEEFTYSFGLSVNAGIYGGSFSVWYDPSKLEFASCELTDAYSDMVLSYSERTSEDGQGYIDIAFTGTELNKSATNIIDVNFIAIGTGETVIWYGNNLTLTNSKLEDMILMEEGSYTGTTHTIVDREASNFFSVTAPENVAANETFDVIVGINNNSGFSALTSTIKYDPTLFEYVGAELIDDTFNALSSFSGSTKGEVRLGIVSSDNLTYSGDFAKITLKAKSDIENCTTRIDMDITELVDSGSLPLSYSCGAASISCSSVPLFTYGDVNDDGRINNIDVLNLRKYIAGGWNVTINESAADVNCDGRINNIDVLNLRKYIAGGWGVVLGPKS